MEIKLIKVKDCEDFVISKQYKGVGVSRIQSETAC